MGNQRKGAVRASLEVPDGTGSPVVDKSNMTATEHNNHIPESAMPEAQDQVQRNGNLEHPHAEEKATENEAEKRDSLNRGSRFPTRRTGTAGSLNRSSGGSGGAGTTSNLEGERPVGVQLSDAPMDD